MTKGVRTMKKRLLAGLLAVLLLAALFPAALASNPGASESTVIQVVGALGILTGDGSGDLRLDDPVTRAEFAKMLVAASAYKDKVAAVANSSPFKDVPYTHWAASYIKTAVQAGYLTGYLDGTYRPNQNITLEEAATGCLKLLGYTNSDFSGSFPYGQLALYSSLGLSDNITAVQGSTMTRRNMMYLFYNLLSAENKSGSVHLTTLGYQVDSSGEIDYLSLMTDTLKGPYVVTSSLSGLGISTDGATVYRNGSLSTPSAVRQYDVVYYSAGLNALWVYSNAITGTCQAISPSTASPNSVTVAGNSYTLATSEAKLAFSALGSYPVGSSVTLLLGRDNEVVSVLAPGSYSASANLCGVITALGSASYTDASGNSYTDYTITLTATNGASYTYTAEKSSSWKVGSLVQVTVSGSSVSVKSLSSGSTLSGKVNSTGTALGRYSLASDVEILDVSGSAALRVYPSRLAGITMDTDDIRYSARNSDGEITKLILDDFTGDLYQYGVVLSVSESSGGMSLSGRYTYDIGGQSYSHSTNGSTLNVSTGPAKFLTDEGILSSVSSLSSVKVDAITGNTLTAASGSTYTLSESVVVYEVKNGSYYYSSLGAVLGGSYTLTAYYDRTDSEGGRIRVILAR